MTQINRHMGTIVQHRAESSQLRYIIDNRKKNC